MLNDVMLTRRGALTALSSSAATLALSACSSSNDDEDSSIPTSVEYSMWDSGQQPAYQACADRFKEKTGITVNITQIGWNGYWTKLTAGFIAGTGPDAFADHIQKFAQLVDLDVLLPLEEQAAWVDVDVSAFQEGLLELWKGEDGHQYGCPKDLGHRGDLLQQGHGALHRPVTGGYGRPGMESGRRRHLREGVGSLDRRRQRRAQRRARVQPGAHRDLRNRHSELRRRRRADPVEPIHRLNR